MMNPDSEIYRLVDLLPASGRMFAKIKSKPEQPTVIAAQLPKPWDQTRPVFINFDLWSQLSKPQRDLLILRTVNWLGSVNWLKPNIYQGLVAAGVVGTIFELVQGDIIGAVTAGGLTSLAGTQIWRKNYSSERELEADEAAVRVAVRRGYSETDAARHLMAAIESVSHIEGRSQLDFTELLRVQNLKAIAGLSPVGVPQTLRRE
nr:DUF3318 domain-containing protein [Oculatella sp. FACHB-28]